MHQEHVTGGKIGQQIFSPAPKAGHSLTLEPRDEVLLEREPEVFAPGLRADDLRSFHGRLQAAADGLDFGQFGHRGHSPCGRDVIAPSRRARYGPAKEMILMDRRDETAHFGFRDVPLDDKQTLVNDVFHSVASRYELLND